MTGAKKSKGWDFGENLYLSDLYALLSKVQGVDNIQTLIINGTENTHIDIPQDTLVSHGDYTIDIKGLDPVRCRT